MSGTCCLRECRCRSEDKKLVFLGNEEGLDIGLAGEVELRVVVEEPMCSLWTMADEGCRMRCGVVFQ